MHPTLREVEAICQKPHWREVGSLLARRMARPAAVYLTWLAVRSPVSANAITGLTLLVGIVAAVLLGTGRPASFVAGAAVLNLWYLFDHVDGQVARFRRSESVTGIYFDFMMHHIVHPAVAFALGYGIAAQTGQLLWSLGAGGFALGLTTLSLANDCRYKAFFAEIGRRAKRLEIANCKLEIANRPMPRATHDAQIVSRVPTRCVSWLVGPFRWLHRAALKLCQMPNVIIAVTVLAALLAIRPRLGFQTVQGYVLVMSILAPVLGLARLVKQVWLRQPDTDFQSWNGTK